MTWLPPLALHLELHRRCNDVDGRLHSQPVVILDTVQSIEQRLAHLGRHRVVQHPLVKRIDKLPCRPWIGCQLIEWRQVEGHCRRIAHRIWIASSLDTIEEERMEEVLTLNDGRCRQDL